MPTVTTCVAMPNLSQNDVWPVLSDFERYPERMVDVVSVSILERNAEQMISSWEVLLNGSRFTWTERDTFHWPNLIIFDQIDGDLEVWRGQWQLAMVQGVLEARLSVEFDLGIPSLAEILNPIGERAIRANSRQMLDAVRTYSTCEVR
ncbi:hypothetical protein LJR245_007562 [Rhizobium leguminosarum]|uniref:type II toxin-antitoxin system RatA family toxin n=1 Tax=Rhizobium leguminosarum TaxID=384 RepID=UPI003ECEC6EF